MAGFLVGLNINDVAAETFSGNASTTAFTLAVAGTTNTCGVYILGVHQVPSTDYSVSGTTLTFTAAPPSGTNNICVVYTKPAVVGTPADGTITTAKLSGNLTLPGKITAAGDTAASDNASMGYTSAEGLILTGQGSTNDVTIKNDADADVITIATGGTAVDVVGALTAGTVTSDAGVAGTTGIFSSDVTGLTINATGDTAASDNAAIGYTSAEGLILTGQGSTNDVTIKNDADADVMTIATGTTTVGFADGAVATPSITNIGDLNTGVYFPAADTVGVTAGGTEQFRFGSNPIPGGNKNLVINGAMTVSQRGVNAVIATGFDSTTNTYGPDRFLVSGNGSPQNRGEVEHVSSGGPTGFPAFFRYDITTAESAVAAGEATVMQQRIEGYITNRLSWGNAAAKAVTLSFYMRSPKSGTHCVSLGQSGGRHYLQEFTVDAADTWEKHELTFPGDTSGSMNVANTEGLRIIWPIIAGSTYQGSGDSWIGASDWATSNQQNLADSTSNNIDLTGVQLEIGSVATDFEHEDYGTTLQKCYRYMERFGPQSTGTGYTRIGSGFIATATTVYFDMWYHPKRAVPSITSAGTCYANYASGSGTLGSGAISGDQFGPQSALCLLAGGSSMTLGRGVSVALYNNGISYVDIAAEF